MKKIHLIMMLLSASLFFIACGGSSDAKAVADKTEEPGHDNDEDHGHDHDEDGHEHDNDADAKLTVVTENATYKTVILEDGIPSPRKEMSGKIGETTVTLNYGSPSLKGRGLGTELAPHGKLWRTGANMCTTIEVSNDVNIDGQKLAAGKYSVFTIPNADEWVVAFNKDTDQGGTRSYDDSKDAFRIKVKPATASAASEAMEFIIDGDVVALHWGSVKVPFSISAS